MKDLIFHCRSHQLFCQWFVANPIAMFPASVISAFQQFYSTPKETNADNKMQGKDIKKPTSPP